MRSIIALLLLSALIGCAWEPSPAAGAGSQSKANPEASAPAGAGSVEPMVGGAAGGLSPVTGGESVDGAGMGSMGNVAKDRARAAASSPAAPAPTEENGE
jgi:hypothetical protein